MLDQAQIERLEVEAVNAAPSSQPLYAARKKIFPKRAEGRFRRLKWLIMAVTLGIYYFDAVAALGPRRRSRPTRPS